LAWNASPGATAYNIHRGNALVRAGVRGTSFTVTGLAPDTAHEFRVFAVSPYGNSDRAVVNTRTLRPPVSRINFNTGDFALNVGQTRTITATVLPTNAADRRIEWITGNSRVATVSNGVVRAHATGQAHIVARARDGSGVLRRITVTVRAPLATQTGGTSGGSGGTWGGTNAPPVQPSVVRPPVLPVVTVRYNIIANNAAALLAGHVHMLSAQIAFYNTFRINLVLQASNTTTALNPRPGCSRSLFCNHNCGLLSSGADCRQRHHRSGWHFLYVDQVANTNIFRFVDYRLCFYFGGTAGHGLVGGLSSTAAIRRNIIVTAIGSNPRVATAHEISHLFGARDNVCAPGFACVMSGRSHNLWCPICHADIMAGRNRN